jgi:hypothetical protein
VPKEIEVQRGHKEMMGPLANLGSRDPQVLKVHLDHLVHKVKLGLLGQRVLKDLLVKKGIKENQANQGKWVLKVNKGNQEHLGKMVLLGLQDLLVKEDSLGIGETLEHQEHEGNQGSGDHLDQKDHQDQLVIQDHKDHLVRMVEMVM